MSRLAPSGPGQGAPGPEGRRTRSTWGLLLADQVLSGTSNALAVVLVARVLDAPAFGRFALGYACLTFFLTASRAYFGGRLVLEVNDEAVRRRTGALLGAVLLLAAPAAVAVLAVSVLAVGTASLPVLVVIAVATPVVCTQDLVRVSCASLGAPWAAVLSDALWVVGMAAPLVLGLALTATSAMAVWLLSAVVAAALALALARQVPDLRAGWREVRRRDGQGNSFTLGSVATALAPLALLWVVAGLLSEAGAGSLRGAATAMGPVNVLLAFTAVSVTAVFVRRNRQADVRRAIVLAGALCACAVAWGAVLLLIPERAGVLVFGASWPGVHRVLPWTVAEYVLLASASAGIVGLRVRARNRSLLAAQLVQAVLTLVAGGIAALLFDSVPGVAAALVLTAAVSSAIVWTTLVRSPATTSPDLPRQVDAGPGNRAQVSLVL